MLDAKALAEAMAPMVKNYVALAIGPLMSRIAELEARQPERGERGLEGPAGKDGVGLAGAFINKNNVLILTLSDGSTRDLGVVVGKDGRDGADGAPGERGERGEKGDTGERGPDGPAGRDGIDGADGRDGADADMDALKSHLTDEIERLMPVIVERAASLVAPGAVGPEGPAGKDADPLVIKAMIDEAISALPLPEKGDKGEPGRNVDPAEVARLVSQEVEKAVASIPPAKDGKDGTSVTVEDIAPLIEQQVSKAVSAIPVPKDGAAGKDGAGLADAVIDRDGNLTLTFTDGRTKQLGKVIGENGRDIDPEEVTRFIEEQVKAKVAEIPVPQDGKDGFGFDDLSLEYDGERTIAFVFERGDDRQEFVCKMPIVIDRGLYRDGRVYERGDSVTFGGSTWIAQRDTDEKPEAGDAWRLAVKRGRDGRAGKDSAA